MLGFETRREPIRGEFAKRIREQLRRAHAAQPYEIEEPVNLMVCEPQTKYNAVWK